jgi:hypothetical protein
MATWRAVTSKKPAHLGEAFLMRGNRFVLKVYRDSGYDGLRLAQYLAAQLQRQDDHQKLVQDDLSEVFPEVELDELDPICCLNCGAIPERDGVDHFPSCVGPKFED